VVEAPFQQRATDEIQIRIARRILQAAERRLRIEQVDVDVERSAVLVPRHDARTLALHQADGAAARKVDQRLRLDLRRKRKGRRIARRAGRLADLDLIAKRRLQPTFPGKARRQLDPSGLAAARAGPQREIQAFARQVRAQRVGRSRLQKLQPAVEVGLADAVRAHEHIEARHRIVDPLQRAVARGGELANRKDHGRALP
jgi:hypothetical protein